MAKFFLFTVFYAVMIIHCLNCAGGHGSCQGAQIKHCCTAHVMIWTDNSIPGEVVGDWWLW